jgi:hypothetical protein
MLLEGRAWSLLLETSSLCYPYNLLQIYTEMLLRVGCLGHCLSET